MTRNEQLEQLQLAMRQTKDRRLFERYQSVFLHFNGKTNVEIAAIIQRNRVTVGSYIKAYKNGGLPGLEMGISTGKPSYLSMEQRAELANIITTKTPADVGFAPYTNWTLALLVSLAKREWDVSYSIRGMSKLLHRMGFSNTRPTYTLAKADPEKQKTFIEETFPALKKLIFEEIDHILFQDESMIRDYQAIQKTWFPKGQQRKIPTYGKHQGVKLVGTLNYETGEIFCIEEETYDAEVFLAFLKKVIIHYPTGKIVMILDNSRIHHAKKIQPFLEENKERIQFVFLPPYSPQLNLIEGLWKWLKETVINNVFFPSTPKIKLAVRNFVRHQNLDKSAIIDRLCVQL